MRIAQIATSSGPVREDRTGSVEAMVWLLSRELTALGHDVTVFGCAGSEPPCELVVTQPGAYGERGAPSDWQLCDWMTLCRASAESERFDVLHSHAYLWGLPLAPLVRTPMVHTMHTFPYDDERALLERFPEALITGLSAAQWRGVAPASRVHVVHHGVDPAAFSFGTGAGGYACYLGRFIPAKGPLLAVAAAREANLSIVLAGPENEYFRSSILPLVDGSTVRYAGPVDRRQRDELLGGASVLLYPLQEPEPFGLVQVEAMMCGTPVAALRIGAVPEVVEPGLTGSIAETPPELAAAVRTAAALNRASIRARALERFTCRKMARAYETLYGRVSAPARSRA